MRRAWSGLGRLTPVALVALLGGMPARAAETDDKPSGAPESARSAFEPGAVWKVHLTLPAAEFAAMQPRGAMRFPGFGPAPAPPPPPAPEDKGRQVHRNTFGLDLPWATGTVAVGGETFQAVGVRYKGNGTILDAARTIKKSLKIDLDHFGGSERFRGLKTLNLHCGVTDPSKCREVLGYALFRAAGVPAPRTALAEVRLTVPGKYDGELLGLYTLVEPVDKPFLRAHFGTDKGLLMKPEMVRDFEDRGDDWGRYEKQYAPKRTASKDEAARMIAFARLVQKADDAAFRKEIDSYLDVDGYLRFLAVTSFVANTDSFFVGGHNYYLYLHPKTRRFHFIPWDLDRAFANFPILGSNEQQMDLSLTRPYAGTHRLTDRLLATPEIAARYRELLKDLAAGAFDKARLLKQLEVAQDAVKELADRDAKAGAARKEGGGFAMFGMPPPLSAFIEKRSASVAAQIAGASKGYVPVMSFGPPGGFGPPPRPGQLVDPPTRAVLRLTPEQEGRLDELQKTSEARLDEILSPAQRKQFREIRERGPGGFGPPGNFGPGARPEEPRREGRP